MKKKVIIGSGIDRCVCGHLIYTHEGWTGSCSSIVAIDGSGECKCTKFKSKRDSKNSEVSNETNKK